MSPDRREKPAVCTMLSLSEAAIHLGVTLQGLLALIDGGHLRLARFDEPRIEPAALAAIEAVRGRRRSRGYRTEPSRALAGRENRRERVPDTLRAIPTAEFRAPLDRELAAA